MIRPGTFALTALLAALTGIGPFTTDMYLPSLPDLARQLGASTAQAQLTISAYLIGFAVGQVLYGPLADRHGRRPVLLAALAIYCVGTLICAVSTSIEMLIAARVVQAIGGSGGIVLSRAVVRDLYSGARAGRELSVIGAVMALAPVIAPAIGGALELLFGWRSSFVVLMGCGLVLGGIVWRLFPETVRVRAAEPVSPGSILRSYRLIVREPAFLAYCGLSVLSFAGLFAWISGSPFVLQNVYGLTPFQFGFAFAVGSAGFMSGTIFAARLVGRFGLNTIIGIGSVALATGGVGMVAVLAFGLGSAVTIVGTVAIYLAGMGLVLPQSTAGAMTPFPDRAGAASSLLGFIQQSIAAICGAAVGLTLGHSAWPLAIAIALMGSTALVLWLLTRGVRNTPAHS